MSFSYLLRTLHIDFGPHNEFLLLCIATLVMLMVAAYLFISHRSFWHTLLGIIIALVAALYLLDAAGIFSLAELNLGAVLPDVATAGV